MRRLSLLAKDNVTGFDPEYVSVTTADRTRPVELPVQVRRTGELPEDVLNIELTAVPAAVTAEVPIGLLGKVRALPTEPVDLSAVEDDSSLPVRLVPPEQIELAGDKKVRVKVVVQKPATSPKSASK